MGTVSLVPSRVSSPLYLATRRDTFTQPIIRDRPGPPTTHVCVPYISFGADGARGNCLMNENAKQGENRGSSCVHTTTDKLGWESGFRLNSFMKVGLKQCLLRVFSTIISSGRCWVFSDYQNRQPIQSGGNMTLT